jgi:CDP-6-deoxy-D-xylo-4-hexulose-3-dehydrase
MENTFWIGLYPGLTTAHLSYVADKIEEFIRN